MESEKMSGPGSFSAAEVDSFLEDRDRLWCLALLSSHPYIGIDYVQSVLRKYGDLRSREKEVLAALHNPEKIVRL